ncbi:hypothetical protein AAF712_009003 [Marasmius tenuissimus]|uniref:Uncharacterized protein n=1 Tax=Marasmius tenuissimus TaxID=585030 RepID=A0ABR2ZQS6_9AGAR
MKRDLDMEDLGEMDGPGAGATFSNTCVVILGNLDGPIMSGDDEVTKLRSHVSDLKRHICNLKQEIDNTETELHDIEDLIYNVNGKTQKEKEDLEDLEDLHLVALSWLEKSDVVPSLPLPSS